MNAILITNGATEAITLLATGLVYHQIGGSIGVFDLAAGVRHTG